jgi:hypothetical protein
VVREPSALAATPVLLPDLKPAPTDDRHGDAGRCPQPLA